MINTYSGHEKKVKNNLEHRVETMGARGRVRHVVVPTEEVAELKDGKRELVSKRTMPGYVLVNMEMTDDAWGLVKNTPGVTGFVGSRNKPVPLSPPEADRLLHRDAPGAAPQPRVAAGGGTVVELDRQVGEAVAPAFAERGARVFPVERGDGEGGGRRRTSTFFTWRRRGAGGGWRQRWWPV